jgi:hypothetical protein
VGSTCQRVEREAAGVHTEDAYAYSGLTVGLGTQKAYKMARIR